MLFQTRIRELEAQLAEAGISLQTITAERDELRTANTEFLERHTADTAALAAMQGERDAALGQVATLTAERDAAVANLLTPAALEERVSQEVTARIGAAGIAPIARDPKVKTEAAEESGLTGRAKATAYFAARLATSAAA